MRLRDIITLLVSLTVAAILLIAAGTQLNYINSQRKEMKLISNEPLKNAPPSLAFATVAMGAFRGLLVDVLWMRADKLKEQGQFFDAKQLADWITTLQPRFPSVWEFQAWNMAYNISAAIPAEQPEQRWRWVKNGYELLRDEGIELNPNAILLYRELARIFQHKIGGITDDAHKYYKLQLAMAMQPLLGPADNETFTALAEAPTQWGQITKDANIAPLITALKIADETFADDDKFVANYLSLREEPKRFKPQAFETIDNFRGSQALKKFDIFAKACQLRRQWKLEPNLMQQLNKTYGPVDWDDPNKHLPLDWRHPDSHAIYWAVMGLQTAGKEKFSVDEANTDRIVVHSLQNLFRYGKIFIYKSSSAGPTTQEQSNEQQGPEYDIFLRPVLRLFEPYSQAILKLIEKYVDPNDKTESSYQISHRNMLKNAVLSFYQAGHIRQAEKIYSQLRQLYPREEFNVPLVAFARRRLLDELERIGINDATEIIQMLLREGYFKYAIHDDDEAFGREKMAEEVYEHYQARFPDEQERIGLPDLKLIRYLALIDFLNDAQYPPNLRRSLLGRIKVERPELIEQLKQQEEMLKKIEQQRTG